MTEQEVIKSLKIARDDLYRLATHGHENFETEAISLAITVLEEIQQYRAIGTVEECREAAEKQRAYKPIKFIDCVYGCKCGNKVTKCYDYCEVCGQKFDWGDGE